MSLLLYEACIEIIRPTLFNLLENMKRCLKLVELLSEEVKLLFEFINSSNNVVSEKEDFLVLESEVDKLELSLILFFGFDLIYQLISKL